MSLASLTNDRLCCLQTCQSLPNTWRWNTSPNSTAGSTLSGPPLGTLTASQSHTRRQQLSLRQEIRPWSPLSTHPRDPLTCSHDLNNPMCADHPTHSSDALPEPRKPSAPAVRNPGRTQNRPGCFMPLRAPQSVHPAWPRTPLLVPGLWLATLWNHSYNRSCPAGRSGHFSQSKSLQHLSAIIYLSPPRWHRLPLGKDMVRQRFVKQDKQSTDYKWKNTFHYVKIKNGCSTKVP